VVHATADALVGHLQLLVLPLDLLVASQCDLGASLPALVVFEVSLEAVEVVAGANRAEQDVGLCVVDLGEIFDKAMPLCTVAIEGRILLECEALLLPVATGPDGRQLLALPVLGLVHRAVALTGAGGIPGVVHRLVLALFVVDPTELSVRPLLD